MTKNKEILTKEIEHMRKGLAKLDKMEVPIAENEELIVQSKLLDKKLNEFYKADKK